MQFALHAFFVSIFVLSVIAVRDNSTFLSEHSFCLLKYAHPDSANRTPAQLRIVPLGITENQISDPRAADGLLMGPKFRHAFLDGDDPTQIVTIKEPSFDYSKILPQRMSQPESSKDVATQIFDHSVSQFFRQEAIRNTFVGKTAHFVEERMKAKVDFGGSEPQSIKHQLKFQMKATQANANIQYSGITNAELNYSMTNRNLIIELFEPISTSSKLVYSHVNAPGENRDILSYRLNW